MADKRPGGSTKLHNLIFVGMALGLAAGIGLHAIAESHPAVFEPAVWWLDLLGPTLFIGALKMIIAPLILASIVAGVTSLPDIRELGSIGYKTIVYYLGTTAIAVSIGLAFVIVLAPGETTSSQRVREARAATLAQHRVDYTADTKEPALVDGRAQAGYLAWLAAKEGAAQAGHDHRFRKLASAQDRTPADMFKDDIVRPILSNPFQSLAADPPNALGIIFFALLFGIGCTVVGERAQPVIAAFQAFNDVIMKITQWLMNLSPIAIACIIASLVAKNGPGIFESLGWYCVTVIAAIAAHVAVLVILARVIGKTGPRALWRGIREAWLIAFSTRSSAATLPVTIRCVVDKLRVRPKVANFSLPLGATVNMDGTALYEGVAVIFLIQIYGGLDDANIPMTAVTTLLIFVTAVLASIGAAAVPDAGLVTMVLVASAVHLPIYYIPFIFAVDAFLDMFRTSTNVLGDVVGAVVVDRLMGPEPATVSEAADLAEPEPA